MTYKELDQKMSRHKIQTYRKNILQEVKKLYLQDLTPQIISSIQEIDENKNAIVCKESSKMYLLYRTSESTTIKGFLTYLKTALKKGKSTKYVTDCLRLGEILLHLVLYTTQ